MVQENRSKVEINYLVIEGFYFAAGMLNFLKINDFFVVSFFIEIPN